MSADAPVARIDLLGMPIARLTSRELIEHVFRELAEGRGGWILTANLDKLQRFVGDAETAALYSSADLIVADGIPLLWACRIQGTPLPGRVAGADLVWALSERSAEAGRALYLLGGNPGAAEGAARRFRERWPSLRISGISSPRVSLQPTQAELAPLRESLREAAPDLVYVALGAPKEEHLIAALRTQFPKTWWIGIGIGLSFAAGDVTRAPAWMQKTGIEWLHRLMQEPRRLARRYLIENLPFVLQLFAGAWRARS